MCLLHGRLEPGARTRSIYQSAFAIKPYVGERDLVNSAQVLSEIETTKVAATIYRSK